MEVLETNLKGSFLIKNKKFIDDRGFFIETFSLKEFKKHISFEGEFVQDNHSMSSKGVLRGLHYQIKNPQGKLVRCVSGSVFDVIVDIRKSSPTFGKWFGVKLCENNMQLWVPPGFAHGFYTLSDYAEVTYKVTDYYYPEYDRTLIWNDEQLNIDWGIIGIPKLSEKDLKGKTLAECDKYD